MPPQLFVATKAFIVHDEKILIVRESNRYAEGTNAGLFDVPGGRVQPGQHFAESLQREVQEETGLQIAIGQPFFVNEWRPTIQGKPSQIVGIFFICTATNQAVTLSQDHQEFQWITPADYRQYPLIENLHAAFAAYLEKAS